MTNPARLGVLLLLLPACKPADYDDDNPDPKVLFSDTVTRVVVEVDYMPGAEPYTGDAGQGRVWNLFERNAGFLLADKDLVTPDGLDDMEEMTNPGEASYDRSAILAMSEQYRDSASGDGTAAFHGLWIDGYFEDSQGVQDSVIGVSFTGTTVVAMFAPVVQILGLTEIGRAYGEQATFVHEFGHAIGLVNNGVPLTSAHHDAEHGAHCTESSCVMYWAYEGSSELAAFVAQYITTNDTVLFGDECADDIAAIRSE